MEKLAKIVWQVLLFRHFLILIAKRKDQKMFTNKDKVQILEIQVPCNVCTINECAYNKKYYIRSIEGGSWNSWDSLALNFMLCNKTSIIYVIIIIILTIIIIYRIMR
jgi:hypothetical protein